VHEEQCDEDCFSNRHGVRTFLILEADRDASETISKPFAVTDKTLRMTTKLFGTTTKGLGMRDKPSGTTAKGFAAAGKPFEITPKL
jgi:hypothetical protein